MIRFHISKLAVTMEWKSLAVDKLLEVRREQYMKKAHESILDRQCASTFYV